MSQPTATPPLRRHRRRVGVAVAGLTLALGLAGCGGADDTSVAAAPQTASGNDATAAQPDVETTEAESAADASSSLETVPGLEPRLVDLIGGGQIDINSLEGSDTVLWFWAPW